MATIITNKPHKVAWIDFVNQTGATDRKPLYDYVEGCFDLGIWDNMVCWPLRSSQQLTTGTSVISLGGLGSFNGTIAGSPSTVANGMFFTKNSGQFIQTSLVSDHTDHAVFSFAEVLDALNYYRLFGGNGYDADLFVNSGSGHIAEWRLGNSFNTAIIANSVGWHYYGGKKNGTTFTGICDAASANVTTETASDITLKIGGSQADTTWHGTIALAAYFDTHDIDDQAFRTLYKTTLGVGLSLP
jgi:hypothetical protein